MPAPDFLDTNVMVHAYDPGHQRKHRIAQDLVRRALTGDILVSTQVLAELAAPARGGCARIWSEDLNHGQAYFGVVVSNPFN